MEEIGKIAQNVESKNDFIRFVEALATDFRNNSSHWENSSLDKYLGAIQSWTEDMEGYYINNNLPLPENVNWKAFANILLAAKMYE
jgi:hypothetical protein